MVNLKRARSWKRLIQPKIDLKNDAPVLYPETWLCIVCVLAKVKSFVLKATAVGAIY